MKVVNKAKNFFNSSEGENIILEGTKFTGTINTDQSIQVMGELSCPSINADKIYIKKTGKVKAKIKVNNFILEGILIGDVKANVRLILAPFAKLLGNISSAEVISSEGVIFEGQCRITADEKIEDISKHITQIYNQGESFNPSSD